ncbi:hypothetical protein ABMA46_17600 [Mesorhizobium sp. CN5-321]|uniref:hypothetical protein n=1 Tax=Mesorhizobium hunchu TaxID=3157708 RepID=UPI0032B7A2E8
MSDFALKPAAARAPALHIVLDWLKQARVAARLPVPAPASPPDPLACDVGLDREEIVRKVDRGSVEIGLLSLGWQPPRTSSRR